MAGRSRIRTDLALEATERFREENVEVHGVEIREKYDEEKEVSVSWAFPAWFRWLSSRAML